MRTFRHGKHVRGVRLMIRSEYGRDRKGTMTSLDLVIRGGEIATAGTVSRADIGIAGGVIAQIGGDMGASREVDATNKLLLPGGIDAHVHLSLPPFGPAPGPHWVDDFTSGSAAGLAGGMTTLGNMSFMAPGETPLSTLEREAAIARRQTIADLFLHPVLTSISDEIVRDIPRLMDAGCNSIKYFMLFPPFDAQVSAYVQASAQAGSSGMITLIHCEDSALIEASRARLVAAGQTSLRFYPQSCPVVTEVVATQRAVAISEVTGAPVYIVHLSSECALDVCADAQSRGVPVYVETRPLYLHLTEERFTEPDGAKYVGAPPLRRQQDVDALWAGIQQGTVHTVCSDHAPYLLADKLDPSLSIVNIRAGVENLQTLLPMLYSEGVRTGRISLSRLVEVTSTNAAKLFGLYPQKGTIAVGSDADIVVFDPSLARTVRASLLKSNADYSVYDGWEVTGWPVVTIRRGEIVFRDDTILGSPGSGRLVRRGRMQAL
jgi:dihydropyrimidinase